ncbi:MAG TPA: mannonate dehydratase, partial [Luteolibacter sp.]
MPQLSRNPLSPALPLLEESFRWFGPSDTVPLTHIRQAGAQSVYTSLHEIPYGETWSRDAIRARIDLLAQAGLTWSAAESVPVHEDIKTGGPRREEFLKNYAQSLANLGAEGVHTVIYNFMPVLDWVRTDMNRILPDGSSCLHYDPARFAAFEVFALQRPGAENDFNEDQ